MWHTILAVDNGETVDASTTLRAYNAAADRWEFITANQQTGLQDFGTARRVGPPRALGHLIPATK